MIIGKRLKYLAFSGERVVAALGWKSASLKLEYRDCFIGVKRSDGYLS